MKTKNSNFSIKKLSLSSLIGHRQARSLKSKVSISLVSILAGLLLAWITLILYSGIGQTGSFFYSLFILPFSNLKLNSISLLTSISIAVATGLAVGFSFKTGLFNIGVSGQMLIGGSLPFLIIAYFAKKYNEGFNKFIYSDVATATTNNNVYLLFFGAIFASIIFASMFALIPALLKVFLNVHEVVSSILLNWIAFYLMNSLMIGLDVREISSSVAFFAIANHVFTGTSGIIMITAIVFLMVATYVVIFSFTKLGFKLNVTGKNSEAARYSGMKNKMNTIYSLGISGAFAGIAGFMFIFVSNASVPYSYSPLAAGFDGIVISMLGFNSGIGIFIASIIFGIIQVGKDLAGPLNNLPKEFLDISISTAFYTIASLMIIYNTNFVGKIKAQISYMINISDKKIDAIKNKIKSLDSKNPESLKKIQRLQKYLDIKITQREVKKNLLESKKEYSKTRELLVSKKTEMTLKYKDIYESYKPLFKELDDRKIRYRDKEIEVTKLENKRNQDLINSGCLDLKINDHTFKSLYKSKKKKITSSWFEYYDQISLGVL